MYPSAIEQLVYSNRGFRKSATSSQEAFDRWAVREAMRRAGLDGYLKKATLTGYPGTAAAKELMGGQPSPDELFSDSYVSDSYTTPQQTPKELMGGQPSPDELFSDSYVSDSFAAPQPTYNPSPEYDGSLDIVRHTPFDRNSHKVVRDFAAKPNWMDRLKNWYGGLSQNQQLGLGLGVGAAGGLGIYALMEANRRRQEEQERRRMLAMRGMY